jgi:hypothetical protein
VNGGGGIVLDPQGHAVQQGVDLGANGQGVLLDMAVPCGPAPAGGWPILLWMAGTGGSARAVNISQLGTNLPYAVLSVAPLFSGDRKAVAAAPFNTSEFQFYNYLNPLAARTNLLQQAADVLYLQRLAAAIALAPGEAGGNVVSGFDAGTVVLAGHSQGSSTLPLTLSVDPGVKGAFLSAAGGGLYTGRAPSRCEPRRRLVVAPGRRADIYHPYAQILRPSPNPGCHQPRPRRCTPTCRVRWSAMAAPDRDQRTWRRTRHPDRQPPERRLLAARCPPPFTAYLGAPSPTPPPCPCQPARRAHRCHGRGRPATSASDYPAICRSFVDSTRRGPIEVDPGVTPPSPRRLLRALRPGPCRPRTRGATRALAGGPVRSFRPTEPAPPDGKPRPNGSGRSRSDP